jgi:hypothetical protein
VSDTTREQWIGNTRVDDLVTVRQDDDGAWIAVHACGWPAVRNCPCCGKLFPTARAAQIVADLVYPRVRN